MHKQTFPYEEIGNKDRRRFAQAASRIFHLGGQRSLRDVFQLPFFITGSTQPEQISFGMGAQAPVLVYYC